MIFGIGSNRGLAYQETSGIDEGTVANKYIVSLDGSKVYGFSSSNALVFQKISDVIEGTCSKSNAIFALNSQIGQLPKLSVESPKNITYNESDSKFIPSISVSDVVQNRNLTIKYFIDQETKERESKVIKGTVEAQQKDFSPLSLESVSNGTHRIIFEANNGLNTSRSSLTFNVIKAAPKVLGSTSASVSETGDLTKSVVLPNGYKAFINSSSHKVTIFTSNFGVVNVNSFSPTYMDNASNTKYVPTHYVTLMARPDNTFALFGNLMTTVNGVSTEKTGYMIISPNGEVIDAKATERQSFDYDFTASGANKGNVIYRNSNDGYHLNYKNSNFEMIYDLLPGSYPNSSSYGDHYYKLTGQLCADYYDNDYTIFDLTNGQTIVKSTVPGDRISDIVSRSDGTILIAYGYSSSTSSRKYIRVLNTDFSVKQDIQINNSTELTHLVPLNDNSVLMTYGLNYCLLGKGNTLDPTVYTLEAPSSGEITSAAVFNNGEIVLTDDSGKATFESITYYKAPIVTIVSPTEEQQLSETNFSFTPSITVSDSEGYELTCKYYLDYETVPRDTKTAKNTLITQTVDFSPFNVKSLPSGSHTLRVEVSNGNSTFTSSVGFQVSDTAPILGIVTTTSTETRITVSGDASPKVLDLDIFPFQYTIGTYGSGWTASKTYTQNNLIPNTLYLVNFEARDRLGNTASSAQNVYTRAETPSTVTISGITSTTLDIGFISRNPETTQYQISSGTNFVDSNGILTDSPVWTTVNGNNITVYGLTPLTAYSFRIKARNGAGIETSQTAVKTGTTLANAPDAPQNILPSSTKTSITITWSAVAGATGYDVELNNVVSDNGTSTTRTVSGLNSGTQYTYRVRARFSTKTGNWSSLGSISTQADSPGVPSNLSANATSNTITVTWDAVAGALRYDISVDGSVMDIGTNTSYTHNGLNPDTEHSYKVRAKLATGDGEWSNALTKKTLPYSSGVPVNLTANTTDTGVVVSWDAVLGASGYDIEVDGKTLDNGNNTVFEHSNLTPKTVHNYRVQARTTAGNSGWSDKLTVTTFAYRMPTNINASVVSTNITLTWDAVTAATGYDLMVDGVLISIGTNTTYTQSNLSRDTQHTYQVRTTGPNGTSCWSPVILTSISGDNVPVNVATISSINKIIVTWSAVSGAIGYEVEVDGSIVNNGSATSYTHNAPSNSVQHTYKVRTKISTITSGWSTTVTASIMPSLPLVTTGITPTVSYTTIRLSWTAVSGALGYEVQVDGVIKDNGASTTYLHSDLGSNTTHTYLVRAKNASGIGPWSNTITATTSTVNYVVSCTVNEPFNLMLTATNASNLNRKKFIVTYNQNELEAIDLCSNTLPAEIAIGSIKDTDITITESTPGRIVFTLNRTVEPNTLWSGPVDSIGFKAKITGPTTINYNIQIN